MNEEIKEAHSISDPDFTMHKAAADLSGQERIMVLLGWGGGGGGSCQQGTGDSLSFPDLLTHTRGRRD